jgi:SEC-C motif domain protein
MYTCHCGSNKLYDQCCGMYIDTATPAPTAEALMRSRYCAYTLANIDYIKNTMQGKALLNFNADEARTWAQTVTWLGLQVLKVKQKTQRKAYVTFKASFLNNNGREQTIHEKSEFILKDAKWYYVNGMIK